MPQEIVKFDVNDTISLENSGVVKQGLQDEYFTDNKVCVSETTININNTIINECMSNDKVGKFEMLFVDGIKKHFQISEVSDTLRKNIKVEYGICPLDIQIGFNNKLLFCDHCHEVYQDYCTKCRVLVHILNEKSSRNNRMRELPTYMLEARESTGYLGIFSLHVIPEDVRLGPFTGLDSARKSCLRIKGGRFVVSDDKLELLNWMQYINPARNIYEQNLLPFQYEDELYYCSTRRIQEGEELLVYFGEEYEDNLLKNVEMDFVPITKNDVENVFACIFCCLGFRSSEYLAEHKTVCHNKINEMFSIEELTQCPFCKIYLEAKEYLEHHKDYCCDTKDRYSVHPTLKGYEVQLQRHSSLRSKVNRWKRGIYVCTQCKFRTMCNVDFRLHVNEHYKLKMYQCGICHRRYNAKESLKAHVEKFHAADKGRDVKKYFACEYFKANIKNIIHRRDDEKQCQSSKFKFDTKKKCHLKSQIKMRHLNRGKFKCVNCEFKTYYRIYLEGHTKINHPKENAYKCTECKYKTKFKSYLENHVRAKHLKQMDYKCAECDFRTNIKPYLKRHIKAKHLKEKDYKCMECEYQSNHKRCLKIHIKTKHLKENDYKCTGCEFKTNYKSSLEAHTKAKHTDENDYKCIECEFKTNYKSSLETHIKIKHLKQNDYRCAECEYKTKKKSYLQVHIKAKHLEQNDYKCMKCEFKTNIKSYLQVHIKRKHLKEKDYKCMECEFQTNGRSNLERHVKAKHVKENAYKCTECEFETNYKSSLEAHIKGRHLKQNNYKCTECEFETNYKSALKVHVKAQHLKENDYKCMKCEYMTNFKTNLATHIKAKHLNQNDYKCTECEFKTSYKKSLETHIKAKHLKENAYKCMQCEYRTYYKSDLKKHIKGKHR